MQSCRAVRSPIDIPTANRVDNVKIPEGNLKLRENSFNPLKDSPPNVFLDKLNQRYSKYYSGPSSRTLLANDDTK